MDARKKERDDALGSLTAVKDAKSAAERAEERLLQAQEALKAAKTALRSAGKVLDDPPPSVCTYQPVPCVVCQRCSVGTSCLQLQS